MAHRFSFSALAAAASVFLVAGSQAWSQEALPWQQGKAAQSDGRMYAGASDAYRPDGGGYGSEPAQQGPVPQGDVYRSGEGGEAPPYAGDQPAGRRDSFSDPAPQGGGPADTQGYGAPYSPPPQTYEDANRGSYQDPRREQGFEQGEIVGAGHRFFGSVSGGIANAIESIFKSQGRPNGYILGEDAGGAFIVGLRYGEGTLFTRDAGEHRVFWQGPSVGYDAGGDGSKTMVLVYNLRDPSEIYERFGGVQGAAYVVGGVSVQIQKYNDVTLAVIRSGLGLRLGANVGYMKYTRQPTWNPL